MREWVSEYAVDLRIYPTPGRGLKIHRPNLRMQIKCKIKRHKVKTKFLKSHAMNLQRVTLFWLFFADVYIRAA